MRLASSREGIERTVGALCKVAQLQLTRFYEQMTFMLLFPCFVNTTYLLYFIIDILCYIYLFLALTCVRS